MGFKNGIRNIQAAGYNGACTAFLTATSFMDCLQRWTSFMDKPRDCEAKAGGSF